MDDRGPVEMHPQKCDEERALHNIGFWNYSNVSIAVEITHDSEQMRFSNVI